MGRRTPILTCATILACAYAFMWQVMPDLVHMPDGIAPWLVPLTRASLEGHDIHGLVGHAFLHANLIHILSNMALLYSVGCAVESSFGHIRFAVSYASGIVAGGLAFAYMQPQGSQIALVGASGAIFAVVGTYLVATVRARKNPSLTPSQRAQIRQSEISVIRLIVVNLAYGIFLARGISNTAHVGGLIAGTLTELLVIPRQNMRN